MNLKKIDDWLDLHKQDMLQDLLSFIKIPSVSTNQEKVKDALHFIIKKGEKMGFSSFTLLNGQIGRIEIGEGPETIGVLSHVDVVPAEEGDWIFQPFEGTIQDGWICGRGAMDDKGPLIASLYAMKAIQEMGLPLFKKIQLIIGTQEEVAWTDMKEYVKQYSLPDYGFTPDSSFPIINREKGYFDVEFSFLDGEKVAGEFEVISFEGGEAINSIPSKACAVIKGSLTKLQRALKAYLEINPQDKISIVEKDEYIQVIAQGVAVHSCFPDKGVNAIAVLCKFLKTLNFIQLNVQNLVNFIVNCAADDYYGKTLGLFGESEYYNGEYIHRNVISPTLLKKGQNGFYVYFNLRTVYGTSKGNLDKVFLNFKKQFQYEFAYLDCFEPIYISKDKPYLKVMAESYEEVSFLKNDFLLEHGTTYAKAMPNIVPFGPIFPEETDYCHEANEKWLIDSFMKNAKIFAHSLAKISLSSESFK